MTRSSIEYIQFMLRTVGACAKRIPLIAVDGMWNESTVNALKSFQTEYGLPATGEADFETIEALESSYIICKNHVNEAESVRPFPNCEVQFKKGDYSPVIIIMQVMINAISVKYTNIGNVNANGRFDSDTENAVKQIQSSSSIKPTGIVDKLTWNCITLLYNSFAKRC